MLFSQAFDNTLYTSHQNTSTLFTLKNTPTQLSGILYFGIFRMSNFCGKSTHSHKHESVSCLRRDDPIFQMHKEPSFLALLSKFR